MAHGIAKLILRKTRAECVKQIVIFGKKPTAHSKVPVPVKLLMRIDDGEANEVFAIVVCREIQQHFLD